MWLCLQLRVHQISYRSLRTIVRRWELWVQACELTKSKGRRYVVAFSLHWRTLHVNTRKGGTSREHGYRFSNLVNQYRLFSRSVKPLSSYKLTHNDRANQSAPDVFPGISNYSNNLRTEIPSRSQHLSYIMFSEFLCSRFSHKCISTILEKLFKDLYIYFWIILVINFYKNNNYKHL